MTEANADLLTTSTQADPVGCNPVLICWDRLTGKRLAYPVRNGIADTRRPVRVQGFHIIRPMEPEQ